MQQDGIQINETDTEYAALSTAEISALLQASAEPVFMPSEKIKHAPINFQKKTLAQIAKITKDNEVLDEPLQQLAKADVPETEPSKDNQIIDESLESIAEVEEVGAGDAHSHNASNATSVSSETSEDENLSVKLKNRISELEGHILKLETELADLSSTKTVEEVDAAVLKQLLIELPPLAISEEEKFSQKVLCTIEDIIRTRLGSEISEHPEKFVSKLKQKIRELFVEGSCMMIMLNSEDLEVLNRTLEDFELEQHIKLLASDELGRGDIIIRMGSLEINDSLQVGLIETKSEKYQD